MKAILQKEAVRVGALGALALLLLPVGLDRCGIWDPWELDFAEIARGAGEAPDAADRWPPLARAVVALGLEHLGGDAWAGRFPIAVAGLLLVALVYAWVRHFEGSRAAAAAALVALTTPLLLLNARHMFGQAPAMLAQGLVGLAATALAFAPAAPAADAPRRRRAAVGWALLLVAATALSIGTSGVLLGPLPPLLAVAGAAGLTGRLQLGREELLARVGALLVAALGAALLLGTVHAVVQDAASYSPFLGGLPRGGQPPSFDAGLERAFHALAPWSALAALALGRMLSPELPALADGETPRAPEARRALRLTLVLWAALAYGALTVFTSRYGAATFLALAPVAAATGVFLAEVRESGRAWWIAAVVVALFTGLLIRDFAIYPQSPTAGLALDDLRLPSNFDPKREWALVLAAFAGLSLASLGVAPTEAAADLYAPYRALRAQLGRGLAPRIWLGAFGLLLGGLLVFGVLAWTVGPSIGLPTVATRVGRVLLFVPLGLPPLVALGQLAVAAFGRLGALRLAPLLLAGAVAGVYTVWGFQVALSQHLSPREVFDTFQELRRPGEPLAELQVGSRATRYYVGDEVKSVTNVPALVAFLGGEGRRWVVFPADKLAEIDRAFRAAHGRHLFVADAESGRVLLGTNLALEGRADQNALARAVLEAVPSIQHPLDARFGSGIRLLGYDIELPHDDHVGGTEAFAVTWYWQLTGPSPGAYKVFVHVEGYGNRLNGDHEAVDELYPVQLWQPGDIVADRQELTVPGNYATGDYTIYVGLFRGETRLPVTEGDQDGQNRLRAGVLRIR